MGKKIFPTLQLLRNLEKRILLLIQYIFSNKKREPF